MSKINHPLMHNNITKKDIDSVIKFLKKKKFNTNSIKTGKKI